MSSREAIVLKDLQGSLVALLNNDSSGWLQARLAHVHDLLSVIVPGSTKHCKSDKKGYTFNSIHCDIFNRYAERVSIIALICL
jgi:hypothetical protein